ncbi:hypothetical protein [Povalibacter sp.]|uniref:BufA2 family periplasmic bufferin-type metallophore n=1 Tax=Povalibacter sp. TaxID=1962978 RepID=UPI002F41DE40
MKTSTRVSGAAIATAAAMLFGTLGAVPVSAADDAKVKCEGVNSCKGKSACATAQNACQGQNSCKGHGYLSLSKADCDAAKAKMMDAEKKKS